MDERLPIEEIASTHGGVLETDFESKLRRKRLLSGAMVIAAGISLYGSQFVQPVPLSYLAGMFCVGAVSGLLLAMFGPIHKMWQGLVAGVFFALSTNLVEELFLPVTPADPFDFFWPEISAIIFGMTLVLLPFTRTLLLRTAGQRLKNEAEAAAYRQAGDSRFTAGLRVSANQLGKGRIVTLIVMGVAMGGFGIFAYSLGITLGLAITVMMLAAVAPFVRMLWLLEVPGKEEHARRGGSST